MIYDNNTIIYDGSLLKNKFGYDFYKERYKPTGVVVIFNGSLNIEYDQLVFNEVYPEFFESINICWEIPNLNNVGNVFFKQLFLIKILEELKKINDSLNFKEGQNLISLTRQTESNLSLGIISIDSSILNFDEKQNKDFCSNIDKIFYELTQSCFLDSIKTL